MNEPMDAAIEALVNEVAQPPLVVSETALRQLRPLLQELVERRALASSAAAEMPKLDVTEDEQRKVIELMSDRRQAALNRGIGSDTQLGRRPPDNNSS